MFNRTNYESNPLPGSYKTDIPSKFKSENENKGRNATVFMRLVAEVSTARTGIKYGDEKKETAIAGRKIAKRKNKKWTELNHYRQRKKETNPTSKNPNKVTRNKRAARLTGPEFKSFERAANHSDKHKKCEPDKTENIHNLTRDQQKTMVEAAFNKCIDYCHNFSAKDTETKLLTEDSSLLNQSVDEIATMIKNIDIKPNQAEKGDIDHSGTRTKRSVISDLLHTTKLFNSLNTLVTNGDALLRELKPKLALIMDGGINITSASIILIQSVVEVIYSAGRQSNRIFNLTSELLTGLQTFADNTTKSVTNLIDLATQSTHNLTKKVNEFESSLYALLRVSNKVAQTAETLLDTVGNKVSDSIDDVTSALTELKGLIHTLEVSVKTVNRVSSESETLIKSINQFVIILSVMIPTISVTCTSLYCYSICFSGDKKRGLKHPFQKTTEAIESKTNDKTKRADKHLNCCKSKTKKEIIRDIEDDLTSFYSENEGNEYIPPETVPMLSSACPETSNPLKNAACSQI